MTARLLSAPFTWHFEQHLVASGATGTLSSRPDLIGRSQSGLWFVIEAKGRTHGYDNPLVARANQQARTVATVTADGAAHAVEAQVASISWMSDNGWAARFDDPSPNTKTVSLPDVDFARLLSDYYAEVRAFVLAARQRDDSTSVEVDAAGTPLVFETAYDASLDVFVGLPSEVLRGQPLPQTLAETRTSESPEEPASRADVLRAFAPQIVTDTGGHSWHLGADGVLLRSGERRRRSQH